MKLASVTRQPKIGLKPLSADPECEVKHVNGKLVLILVKHVDDLKIAGEEKEVQLLLKSLGEVFGKSDRNNNGFHLCWNTSPPKTRWHHYPRSEWLHFRTETDTSSRHHRKTFESRLQ